MALVHGQVMRLAVYLARAGEHDAHLRVVLAAGFEDGQLAPAVDVEVGVRVLHRVEMAHLSREVEDERLPAHEVIHAVLVAHVGNVDLEAVFQPGHVEQLAAVLGDERVDDGDARAQRDKPISHGAADEAQAARDEDGLIVEGVSRIRQGISHLVR